MQSRCLLTIAGIVVLLFSPLRAQENIGNSKTSVHGRVVRADTGDAVANARIVLMEPRTSRRLVTMTDDSGRFEFTNLEPGMYAALAQKPGLDVRGGAIETSHIALGERKELPTIYMVPAGFISGVVRGGDGEPLPGAKVWLFSRVYEVGGTWLRARGPGRTDAGGTFRTPGLQPGEYLLAAAYDPQEGATEQTPQKAVYPVEFYPGVIDETSARTVRLGATEPSATADINLTPVPAVMVRGRLIGGNQGRIGSASVTMCPVYALAGELRSLTSNDAGEFEFTNVAPGRYVVEAQVHDSSSVWYGRSLIVVGDSNVEGLVIQASDIPKTVRGQIRFEGSTHENSSAINLHVFDLDEPAPVSGTLDSQVFSPSTDGTFNFRVKRQARLTVDVLPTDSALMNWYTKVLRFNGKDVTDSGFTVDRSATGANLEIVESSDGANVVISVVDAVGKPMPNAKAVIVPEEKFRKSPFRYKSVRMNEAGTVHVKGIAPGDYHIVTLKESDPEGIFYTLEFLQNRKSEPLHVNANGSYKMTVSTE